MVQHLTKETFDSTIASDSLVMVDFWAEWCGPCRMLTPVLDALAQSMSDKISVCKVNTDLEQELAARYNITSIPCVIYFRQGQIVQQSLGYKNQATFEAEIGELLKG
jgi:thioredoxin 1